MSFAVALPRNAAASAAASLPDCLASPKAKARVAEICAIWPPGGSSHHVELRLDGGGDDVDASVAYMPHAMPALAVEARNVPCLKGVLPFLDWAAGARPRSLWLEWDLPDGVEVGSAGPGVFFAPADPTADDAPDFIDAGLRSLGIGTAEREAVRSICTRPGAMRPRQVGVMLSRKSSGVRLVFDTGSPVASASLCALLSDGAGNVVEGLSRVPGFEGARRLDLDATEHGIGPRIGLEAPGAFVEHEDLVRTATGLAQLGLADEQAALAMADAVAWRTLEPGVLIGLSHLKVASEPGKPPVVKAYVGLVPNMGFSVAIPAERLEP